MSYPHQSPEPMDEKELQALVRAQVRSSTSYIGGDLSETRREAMDYYYGRPLGNEIDGRSQVVSTDVQDTVEAVMPDLMQIFGASDELSRFEPEGQEDEETADQATQYVNYVFNRDNEGWLILHDWFKDGLLQVNGVVKVHWDESEKSELYNYTDLTSDELAQVMQPRDGETLEIESHSTRFSDEAAAMLAQQFGLDPESFTPEDGIGMLQSVGAPQEVMQQVADMAVLHDAEIRRTVTKGRCRIENVPPEEFLTSRRARDLDSAAMNGHRTFKTVSELIQMGFDLEVVRKIPSGDENEFNEERVARFDKDDEWPLGDDGQLDDSMREIEVFELYLRTDYDGDGVAELRKVFAAGPAFEILENEEVSEHPFETLTPIRMPHKLFGRSLFELTKDIQLIKTAIWRQLLDNMYNVNNARPVISKKVSLEDVLANRVGHPVRVDSETVQGHIDYMQTVPIGQHAFPLLEYVDSVRETRTGVNRLGQGVDPDALDSTAGGINMLLGRSQQRTLMIANIFAHMGVKRLAQKILRTLIRHQDKPRVIRLKNEWVPMDPRPWNADMDVEPSVGLGHGTQQQQQMALTMVGQVMKEIIAMQGGPNGPLVKLRHLRNWFEKYVETSGLKNADSYMAEFDEKAQQALDQQPPPPNPDMEKVKLDDERARMEIQLKDERETKEILLEHKRKMLELGLEEDARKLDTLIDGMGKAAELDMKRRMGEGDQMMKAATSAADINLKAASTQRDLDIKEQAARRQTQRS